MRWEERGGAELERPRTAESFCVAKADIAKDGAYDLSINLYKETVHEAVEHESPAAIITELKRLEAEIANGLDKLAEMVG